MVTISWHYMSSTLPAAGFGAWLKTERERRGLTALALAEKSGYSHVTIHNIEHGKKGVKRDTVEAIANALASDSASSADRKRLCDSALLAAGFSPLQGVEQELERLVDDEYLQSRILAYDGPNPILRSASATARGVEEALLSAQEMKKIIDESEEIGDDEPLSTSKIKRQR